MKFGEHQLEQAIISLLALEGYPHSLGDTILRASNDVLIKEDLRSYLRLRYRSDAITESEVELIIRQIEQLSASDLYFSNKQFMRWVSDGFLFRRLDSVDKDLLISLVDYFDDSKNTYRLVTQIEIVGFEKRIPDAVLYINGMPLVVFEFKSATREKATIHDAYLQLVVRYRRDIPELLKYNAFLVISDGVNSKIGTVFSQYEHFYAWRKITGEEIGGAEGIDSLKTIIKGLFNRYRLRDVIHNFIFFPDSARTDEKIVCRYPQYYAANSLYANICKHRKPSGDGKGGTYFGATGCGKSYTMLYLARLLMKSISFGNPTILLISDRADLDDQLAGQFAAAKSFIGDDQIVSVESREDLAQKLSGQVSGGVFLTTIQKFSEGAGRLSDRNNIVCISDEAHRSQTNLDPKFFVTNGEIDFSYGFAKYLHESLPQATFVGFTGTPIEATIKVFGGVVDSYTMSESVRDEITVPLAYEGRSIRVALDESKLKEIEEYYSKCAANGASIYAIEETKKAVAQIAVILGDPQRLKIVAADFVRHYERRIEEGATVAGKAIFVSSSRAAAFTLYSEIVALRPEWSVPIAAQDQHGNILADPTDVKPIQRIKMVMTRGQDDPLELYALLGDKEYRKELDRLFKVELSNFKIALVVDMWSTGFDVPFLDTIYIDKPIERHNLIQTISRVNRKFLGKEMGLVVDYVGIREQLNIAFSQFSTNEGSQIVEVEHLIELARKQLAALHDMFVEFDDSGYLKGGPVLQLNCLRDAAEFVQSTRVQEQRFMSLAKDMSVAYEICAGTDQFSSDERNRIHFFVAVRSVIFKLTKGDAPDVAEMSSVIRGMVTDILTFDGVDYVSGVSIDQLNGVSLFNNQLFDQCIDAKLVNTKTKILQSVIARAIKKLSTKNKTRATDFSKKFNILVENYNDRTGDKQSLLSGAEFFLEECLDFLDAVSAVDVSLSQGDMTEDQRAFFDILTTKAVEKKLTYPEKDLRILARDIKLLIDSVVKFPDWNKRGDICAQIKAELIVLLAQGNFTGLEHDDIYREVLEQAASYRGL